MKGKGRLLLILSVLLFFVVFFSRCLKEEDKLLATQETKAGTVSCKQCHQKIYDNYLKDRHHITSRPISTEEVLPGVSPKSNAYIFDKNLEVRVERHNDSTYQVVYAEGKEVMKLKFEIGIGSGKNANTYGFWHGDRLTQLPLTYFKSVNEWTNSPGFPQRIYFQSIGVRCLECHTSGVNVSNAGNSNISTGDRMERGSIAYGINCERCHGPLGQHVEFHLLHPEEKQAKYIKLYKDLNRKQKIDACAVCHSGNDVQEIKSSFLYKPGDDIANYYHYNPGSFAAAEPDVHGNQIGMLEKSQCYINSKDMTCGTCHSPHKPQEDSLLAYSKKCISCHSSVNHSEKTLASAMVKTNCVNCHMPLRGSKVITYRQAGHEDVSAYQLHTHRIGVYQ